MQKMFEEYGGVIAVAIAIISLVVICGIIFTGSGGGVIGESIQTVINGASEKSTKSEAVTEESTNIMVDMTDTEDEYHISMWATNATVIDFDSSYDDSLEIVNTPLELFDEETDEYIPGRALDLSEVGNAGVVGFVEERNGETVVTIAGKDGVVMGVDSCKNMFSKLAELKRIEFDRSFNTSNVTDMSYMFSGATSLEYVDMTRLDTSNVTSMAYMFSGCTALKEVNLSGLDATSVTSLVSMFRVCSSLKTVDFSGFTTSSSLKTLATMFFSCGALESVDLSSFDVSGVTTAVQMFQGCSLLGNVNLSGLTFESLTTMARMFANCKSLKTVDLSDFNPPNLKTFAYTFSNCTSLEEVDFSSMDERTVSTTASLFRGCTSLKRVDISSFTSVTTSIAYMFYDCSALEEVVINKGWDVSSLTTANKNSWLTNCSLTIPETYAGETVITAAAA